MKGLLHIDDDPEILDFYSEALSDHFQVYCAHNYSSASEILRCNQVHGVLIDMKMAEMDGIEMANRLKEENLLEEKALFFLTGNSDDYLRLKGFSLGADDYFEKPIDLEELKVRIHNKLQKIEQNTFLEMGSMKIDLKRRIVFIDGEDAHLTPTEFDLLVLLSSNSGRPIQREKIIHTLWPKESVQNRKLDTHLAYLRKKIRSSGHEIGTVRGLGLVFKKSSL